MPPGVVVRARTRGASGCVALLLWLALGVVPVTAQPLPYTGVNLAGGEFYDPVKIHEPVYGQNFIYPTAAELDYFDGKGMNIIRLPFLWETLQPTAKQPFRPVEIDRLKAVVKLATARGMVVILDPHNYARYFGQVIGGPKVGFDVFADFWARLAREFRNDPKVWFGLVNEPHDMPTEQWLNAANAAIAAIRAAGAGNRILVPGNGWTGAWTWLQDWYGGANGVWMLKLQDSKNNFVFDVHQYLDRDGSGTHAEVVSPTVGSERLRAFTGWCRAHKKRAFLGEFAAPATAIGQQAITDMLQAMERDRDVWTGFAWWAAGARWGDYMFSLEPKDGQDRPQMAFLLAHLHGKEGGASLLTMPAAIEASAGRDLVVAPPVVPARPEMTSPAVMGAKAGSPFLFTVAALGRRPMKFSAGGLPHGLTLDARTGRITGTLPKPGSYSVVLRAANADGHTQRPLRIEAKGTIALTPPLGWNSYDAFGDDVTEAEVLANARYMKAHLQPYGYEYVVVDYRWYDSGASTAPNNPNARAGAALSADEYGRLMPAPNRFPSGADGKGFRPLADAIHAMGLRFGIHVMRGIPRQAVKANLPIEGCAFHAAEAANTASTCGWCPDMYGVDAGKPAGQAWYDSILRQYAGWGVDLIKVDDMSAPYSAGEIEDVRKAIEKCGRCIVLSLSPGATPLRAADHVQKQANMWRISGDFWDDWRSLDRQFDLIAAWHGHGSPGHWPDADMVPLGHLSIHNRSVGPDRRSRFTKNEQITFMSLWALAPSPLMLGMNLPDNDPFTEALLENEEVLAINQDALGQQARRLAHPSGATGTEVWTKELADGSCAVGLFNRLAVEMPVSVKWSELGFSGPRRVRNVWQRKDLGRLDGYEVTLPPHGAALLRVGAGK